MAPLWSPCFLCHRCCIPILTSQHVLHDTIFVAGRALLIFVTWHIVLELPQIGWKLKCTIVYRSSEDTQIYRWRCWNTLKTCFVDFVEKTLQQAQSWLPVLSSPPLSALMFKILSEWWQLSFRRILQQLQGLNYKFKWLWDEVAVAKQSNHCCLYTLRLETRVGSLVRKMLTEGSWRVAFL